MVVAINHKDGALIRGTFIPVKYSYLNSITVQQGNFSGRCGISTSHPTWYYTRSRRTLTESSVVYTFIGLYFISSTSNTTDKRPYNPANHLLLAFRNPYPSTRLYFSKNKSCWERREPASFFKGGLQSGTHLVSPIFS